MEQYSYCPKCGQPLNPTDKVCPKCGNPVNTIPQRTGSEFGNQLLDAIIHLLFRLVYFLFVLPFELWKKAVIRMSKQKKEKALDLETIKSDFPFLSWLKRFTFDFLIDGLTVIAWAVGLTFWIIWLVDAGKYADFWYFTLLLYEVYLLPFFLAITRDLLKLLVVMPTRWFVSFLRRPAKTIDLTHTGSIKDLK